MKCDRLYLQDILDQTTTILREVSALTNQEFCNRPLYQNGMIPSIILIGEAAKHLSPALQQQYPDYPI